MNDLPEVIEWCGAGWYASCQEGSYSDTHIHTYCVGGAEIEDTPDTYGSGLGTPALFLSKEAILERNPDARLIEH